MSAYSDYITDTQRLLHDSTNQFWTEPEKLRYVNQARQRVVRDSGCYRNLIPGYLATNKETYAYGGVTGCHVAAGGTGYTGASSISFGAPPTGGTTATATLVISSAGVITDVTITNQGSGYLTNPSVTLGGPGAGGNVTAYVLPDGTFDVVNLTFYWGNSRVPLGYRPWTVFNRELRYYVGYVGQPVIFSIYGNRTVYVARIPDQAYQVDWDTVVKPPDIVDVNSIEVIAFPFQHPVAFYAAYLAKVKEQSWGEARAFFAEYQSQILAALNSVFTRRLK